MGQRLDTRITTEHRNLAVFHEVCFIKTRKRFEMVYIPIE